MENPHKGMADNPLSQLVEHHVELLDLQHAELHRLDDELDADSQAHEDLRDGIERLKNARSHLESLQDELEE